MSAPRTRRPAMPPEPEDVVIVPYDRSWPRLFTNVGAELRQVLGGVAVRIDHIGSTAVPGLPGKSVIDIQVSVLSFDPQLAYDRPLHALGFRLLPDPEEPAHRFYRRPSERPRLINIHVCEAGGRWERRHLLFRDYLRANESARTAYAELKRRLAERHRANRYDYTDAKAPFIAAVEREAEGWAKRTEWQPGASDA